MTWYNAINTRINKLINFLPVPNAWSLSCWSLWSPPFARRQAYKKKEQAWKAKKFSVRHLKKPFKNYKQKGSVLEKMTGQKCTCNLEDCLPDSRVDDSEASFPENITNLRGQWLRSEAIFIDNFVRQSNRDILDQTTLALGPSWACLLSF